MIVKNGARGWVSAGAVCPVRLQRVDGGPGSNGNAVFLVEDLIYALVVELVDFDVAGTVARSIL
jgi:hypothetical protein